MNSLKTLLLITYLIAANTASATTRVDYSESLYDYDPLIYPYGGTDLSYGVQDQESPTKQVISDTRNVTWSNNIGGGNISNSIENTYSSVSANYGMLTVDVGASASKSLGQITTSDGSTYDNTVHTRDGSYGESWCNPINLSKNSYRINQLCAKICL